MNEIVIDLKKYKDERGYSVELWRTDELPNWFMPLQSYFSMTLPGITRGPHSHLTQADAFTFVGPGNFYFYIWDQKDNYDRYYVGEERPKLIIVPPRIIHAYKNISNVPGIVINSPNQLYKGWDRRGYVDEIRHENDPNSPYKTDLVDELLKNDI
jgi:dTDP-4-dehydrorhamnose 3,5-epimerase